MKRSLSAISALILTASCLSILSCSDSIHTGLNAEGKPVIVVPVPPYADLVRKIAGDSVEVQELIEESDDPHTYSPTPKEIAQLSNAMIYFNADLPFEGGLLHKLSHKKKGVKIISIVSELDRRKFEEGEHDHDDHAKKDDGHDHHDHHGHDHHGHDAEEWDPHVWLSPALLARQALMISEALQDVVLEEGAAEKIQTAAEKYVAELHDLDLQLEAALAPMKGKPFYVYHGAFGYFADAYGLRQEAIELNGRTPEPKALAALVENARADGVKMVFVQPQFDQSSAKSLAESIGGEVISINPLAADVAANLREIAAQISGSTGSDQ